MTTAVIDFPDNEQAPAWWFLDTSVLERRGAPEMVTAVVEMALPVGSAHLLDEDVRPKRRPAHLVARWVPDPRGEQNLICIWSASDGRLSSEASILYPEIVSD